MTLSERIAKKRDKQGREARCLFKIALTQRQMYGYEPRPSLPCPTCSPPKPYPAYQGTEGTKAELGHFSVGDAVRETRACLRASYSSDPGPGTVIELGKRMVLVSSQRGAFWYHASNLEHCP